ncbi:hypothetical protein EVAR_103663_1 [Eumeta japonica]|uniref:Uncharacterized protein n=1 Tax=Eumeta variegata TaxID=151549 RepID=A0A4C1Z562_EUMVA|nr:hypothetical protein EVAR_103663_1 [Eumeta japonica]
MRLNSFVKGHKGTYLPAPIKASRGARRRVRRSITNVRTRRGPRHSHSSTLATTPSCGGRVALEPPRRRRARAGAPDDALPGPAPGPSSELRVQSARRSAGALYAKSVES